MPNHTEPGATILAPLNFIRRQDEKPVFHSAALTGGAPKIFFETEAHTVAISDMRPIAATLSIEREGFELLHHVTAVADLYDDDAIEHVYYPEIESFLRGKFGAGKVVAFERHCELVDRAGIVVAGPHAPNGPRRAAPVMRAMGQGGGAGDGSAIRHGGPPLSRSSIGTVAWETPAAIARTLPEPDMAMTSNTLIMPVTVPSNPSSGQSATMV